MIIGLSIVFTWRLVRVTYRRTFRRPGRSRPSQRRAVRGVLRGTRVRTPGRTRDVVLVWHVQFLQLKCQVINKMCTESNFRITHHMQTTQSVSSPDGKNYRLLFSTQKETHPKQCLLSCLPYTWRSALYWWLPFYSFFIQAKTISCSGFRIFNYLSYYYFIVKRSNIWFRMPQATSKWSLRPVHTVRLRQRFLFRN